MKKLFPIIAMAALLLGACHHQNNPQEEPQAGGTIVPVMDSIPVEEHHVDMPLYLSSSFSCTVRDISASGLVRIQRDSVIWVTASKIIELGRAILTRDSVFGYVRLNNSYVAASYDDVSRWMGRNLNYYTVQDLLAEHLQNGEPISMKVMGYAVNVKFKHTEQPSRLTFPFEIPATAQKMDMTYF